MATATIKYDLTSADDASSYTLALKARELQLALYDIHNLLRSMDKYGSIPNYNGINTEQLRDFLQKEEVSNFVSILRDEFNKILSEYDIDIYE